MPVYFVWKKLKFYLHICISTAHEASYSRALTARLGQKARRLGRGKLKRAGNAGKGKLLTSSHRSLHSTQTPLA